MQALLATSSILFSYVNVPHVAMREKPESTATLCSDAFYSERIEILEEQGDWARIKTVIDGYEGWIKKETFLEDGTKRCIYHTRQEAFLQNPEALEARVNQTYFAHVYGIKDTEKGTILDLPFESRLQVLDESDARWLRVLLLDGKEAYIQRGDVSLRPKPLSLEEVCVLSEKFQGLPYTWGGRSSIGGFDCSGFVQMLFRQMQVFLPRDTKDQIKWSGFEHVELSSLQRGDLIYFGLSEEKIRHVGLFLGDGMFIHATVRENNPKLRISSITDAEWNGSGTFPYRAARRLK